MPSLYFMTHPEVQIDPGVPVPKWPLSPRGRGRMHQLLHRPWITGVGSVWCSTERKAIDGAEIIANGLGLVPRLLDALGENDRTAPGYLPAAEFESTADAFFANPHDNIRGWESAFDAQRRIVLAIETVLKSAPAERDVLVVSHGAVGALLLCHLNSCPISRALDQPGNGGGNVYCFDRTTYRLHHGWMTIEHA